MIRRQLDLARGPVDEHGSARLDLHEPRHCDHTRDAELPGDDGGVAGGPASLGREGDHLGRVEEGSVSGRQVFGDQDRRLLGRRHTGFGLTHEGRRQALLDVTQIGDTLCHEPAHLVEEGDELVDPGMERGQERVACLDALDDGGAQPLVARHAGVGRQHLRRRAARLLGTPGESVGNQGHGTVERRNRRLLVEAERLEGVDGALRYPGRRDNHGTVRNARNYGGASESGLKRHVPTISPTPP